MDNYEQFKKHITEPKIIDYNNINCTDCSECCGAFTFISQEEYDLLHKYFTKNKLGKIKYQRAISRVLEGSKGDILYLKCPLSTGNDKCDIYDTPFRPAICRDFHCYSSENKVTDENKLSYGLIPIINIFKDDLFKNKNYKTKFISLAQSLTKEFG